MAVAIVDLLRDAQVLALPIGEGFFGRRFSVEYKNGRSVRGFFTPIAIDAFEVPPIDFFNRRDGYLLEIADVKPAK